MKKIGKIFLEYGPIKILFCSIILIYICGSFFNNKIQSYISYKDYDYQNDILKEDLEKENVNCVEQQFYSPGNYLSNIRLYFKETEGANLTLEIISDKVLYSKTINMSEYNSNTWNTIAIDCGKIQKNKIYTIRLRGTDLSYLNIKGSIQNERVFRKCLVNKAEVPYGLAIGIQMTYKFIMLGKVFELFIDVVFIIFLGTLLCYSILNFKIN